LCLTTLREGLRKGTGTKEGGGRCSTVVNAVVPLLSVRRGLDWVRVRNENEQNDEKKAREL
jgi:hypothetical protein